MLSLSTVPVYVMGRGHFDAADWIESGCELCPEIGRNRNFAIRTASASGLFLKQVRLPIPELIAAQENEAAILQMIHRGPCWNEVRSSSPRLIDYDQARHVLLIERIEGKTFYDEYASVSSEDKAARMSELSSIAGMLLARFHNAGRRAVSNSDHPNLATSLPVAVTMKPPDPNFLNSAGSACRQIVNHIRADRVFFQQLLANQSHWQSETVIHGDMKWDNLIVTEDANARIKLVDWELASLGDAAWDVAGMLQNYLAHGIDQLQPTNTANVSEVQHEAESFKTSYAQHTSHPCDHPFMERVRRFCAARLIQTAFEREYQSPSLSQASSQLIGVSRSLLCDEQFSMHANLFQPGEC